MERKYKTTVRLLMPMVEYLFTGSIQPVLTASNEVISLLPLDPFETNIEYRDDYRVGTLTVYSLRESQITEGRGLEGQPEANTKAATLDSTQPAIGFEATQLTPDMVELWANPTFPELEPTVRATFDWLDGKVESETASTNGPQREPQSSTEYAPYSKAQLQPEGDALMAGRDGIIVAARFGDGSVKPLMLIKEIKELLQELFPQPYEHGVKLWIDIEAIEKVCRKHRNDYLNEMGGKNAGKKA